jgi:hypothetical protein
MRPLLILLLFTAGAFAEAIPGWVFAGVLMRESSSYYRNGEIVYVNRDPGAEGELGPFQMKRIAFDTVKKPGERFERLAKDQEFAERLFIRYMLWLRKHFQRSNTDWMITLSLYRKGPFYGLRIHPYAREVRRLANSG